MFSHVVLFAFHEEDDAAHAVTLLRGMEGRIPTLRAVEVGVDELPSERSAQVCLVTRFDDAAGMEAYQVHPVHREVLAFMKGRVARSWKVDWTS